MKYKIYPSSFALPSGVTTAAMYKEGCPRYFAFQHLNPNERSKIDSLYMATGRITEEFILSKLKAEGRQVEAEVPIKVELKGGVTISGRADAIVDGKTIYEIKSTVSRSKLYSVINKGEINKQHLGQLLTYMSLLNINHGVLCTSYLHFDKSLDSLKFETRELEVRVDIEGNLYLDGKMHHETVVEFLRFYKIMADAATLPQLPPMTTNDNACKNCPFDKICKKSPKDKSEFARLVNKHADELTVSSSSYTPKIHSHNVKEKK